MENVVTDSSCRDRRRQNVGVEKDPHDTSRKTSSSVR
jgi:hypothetical protein